MANLHVLHKRRTRQHVIADLSIHHVEGFILEEGHTVHRFQSDYGYDLMLSTFDDAGYAEPGSVYFQVKASESLDETAAVFSFDLDIRDYNLWMREKWPVILVLYDASRRRAVWLPIQKYFRGTDVAGPKKGAKSIRVHVPKTQVVSYRAIEKMRELKWQVQNRQGE